MENHNYRLLVIDIDGTLVGGNKTISAENKEALALARQAGVLVALSTGRSLKSCQQILEQLPLDGYHIFFDGALVSRPDLTEEVYARAIDPKVVREMVEYAHQHDIDLELFSTTRYFARRKTWSTDAHREFFGIEATLEDMAGLWERERIIKGGLVTTNLQEEALADGFMRRFGDVLELSRARTPVYPGVTFSNILSTGVSKGVALTALAVHLGIPLESVMAVGDGINDISLLSNAGLAIAMGNASDEVKSVADYITLDVDLNGLAAAISRFLL